ncbi:MAG: PEP-CTERM sorting domain-containing protein, partial [Betaproteobacteria bacterium]
NNPFSGCSARSQADGFVFDQWFGGRAVNELSFTASNGVLTTATFSTAYIFVELVDGTVTHMPEPTTYALLGLGLLGLYARLKRA